MQQWERLAHMAGLKASCSSDKKLYTMIASLSLHRETTKSLEQKCWYVMLNVFLSAVQCKKDVSGSTKQMKVS